MSTTPHSVSGAAHTRSHNTHGSAAALSSVCVCDICSRFLEVVDGLLNHGRFGLLPRCDRPMLRVAELR
eukprot:6294552-Prymnesium_polylepis.1